MDMTRRLDGIERQLNADREAENELEIVVNADTENRFYSLSSKGERTEIGYKEVSQMMEHDTGECKVVLVD